MKDTIEIRVANQVKKIPRTLDNFLREKGQLVREAFYKNIKTGDPEAIGDIVESISLAFRFDKTPEGKDYWFALDMEYASQYRDTFSPMVRIAYSLAAKMHERAEN